MLVKMSIFIKLYFVLIYLLRMRLLSRRFYITSWFKYKLKLWPLKKKTICRKQESQLYLVQKYRTIFAQYSYIDQ